MKITKTRSGKYFNTWTEGDRVTIQDVKSGETRSITRAQARRDLRDGSAKEARKYSDS